VGSPRSLPRSAVVATLVGSLVLLVAIALAVGSDGAQLGDSWSLVLGQVLAGAASGAIALLLGIGLWLRWKHRGRGRLRLDRRERSPVPWWLRPLLLAGALLLIALIGGGLVAGFGSSPRAPETVPPTPPGQAVPETTTETSDASSPAYLVGLAIAVIVAVAVITRLRTSDREDDLIVGERTDDEGAPIVAALTASLDDLEAIADPRAAVVAAYVRMQAVLGSAGLPRRPSETEAELLARILEQLGAGAGPARRLTDLFERARYSTRPVDETMRAAAIAAVVELRAHLTRTVTVP